MFMEWKNIYIFISSTFNDMHAERDYLVKHVFPTLRVWCAARNINLISVDLRWGVSAADSEENKRVVEVCLHNIDKCRPYFLGFLGQRRGWVPTVEDTNSETCELYPGLQNYLERSSVTEMEIIHAMSHPFNDQEAVAHSRIYFRDPAYIEDINDDRIRGIYTSSDEEQQAALEKFKAELWCEYPDACCSYTAEWNPSLRSEELKNLQGEDLSAGRLVNFAAQESTLREDIENWLKAAIIADFPEREEPIRSSTPLEAELNVHLAYLAQIYDPAQHISTGEEKLLEIYAYKTQYDAKKQENVPYILTGPVGSGKTDILSRFMQAHRNSDECVALYAGITPDTSTAAGFVNLVFMIIIDKLRKKQNSAYAQYKKLISLPREPEERLHRLSEMINILGELPETYYFLFDGLEQFDDLTFLPAQLPANIRMICTVDSEDADRVMSLEKRGMRLRSLRARDSKFRTRMMKNELSKYLKDIDDMQIDQILNLKGSENLLYLDIILNELIYFGSYELLDETLSKDYGEDLYTAFNRVQERIMEDAAEDDNLTNGREVAGWLFGILGFTGRNLRCRDITDLLAMEWKEDPHTVLDYVYAVTRQLSPFLYFYGDEVGVRYPVLQQVMREKSREIENAVRRRLYTSAYARGRETGQNTWYREAIDQLLYLSEEEIRALSENAEEILRMLDANALPAIRNLYRGAALRGVEGQKEISKTLESCGIRVQNNPMTLFYELRKQKTKGDTAARLCAQEPQFADRAGAIHLELIPAKTYPAVGDYEFPKKLAGTVSLQRCGEYIIAILMNGVAVVQSRDLKVIAKKTKKDIKCFYVDGKVLSVSQDDLIVQVLTIPELDVEQEITDLTEVIHYKSGLRLREYMHLPPEDPNRMWINSLSIQDGRLYASLARTGNRAAEYTFVSRYRYNFLQEIPPAGEKITSVRLTNVNTGEVTEHSREYLDHVNVKSLFRTSMGVNWHEYYAEYDVDACLFRMLHCETNKERIWDEAVFGYTKFTWDDEHFICARYEILFQPAGNRMQETTELRLRVFNRDGSSQRGTFSAKYMLKDIANISLNGQWIYIVDEAGTLFVYDIDLHYHGMIALGHSNLVNTRDGLVLDDGQTLKVVISGHLYAYDRAQLFRDLGSEPVEKTSPLHFNGKRMPRLLNDGKVNFCLKDNVGLDLATGEYTSGPGPECVFVKLDFANIYQGRYYCGTEVFSDSCVAAIYDLKENQYVHVGKLEDTRNLMALRAFLTQNGELGVVFKYRLKYNGMSPLFVIYYQYGGPNAIPVRKKILPGMSQWNGGFGRQCPLKTVHTDQGTYLIVLMELEQEKQALYIYDEECKLCYVLDLTDEGYKIDSNEFAIREGHLVFRLQERTSVYREHSLFDLDLNHGICRKIHTGLQLRFIIGLDRMEDYETAPAGEERILFVAGDRYDRLLLAAYDTRKGRFQLAKYHEKKEGLLSSVKHCFKADPYLCLWNESQGEIEFYDWETLTYAYSQSIEENLYYPFFDPDLRIMASVSLDGTPHRYRMTDTGMPYRPIDSSEMYAGLLADMTSEDIDIRVESWGPESVNNLSRSVSAALKEKDGVRSVLTSWMLYKEGYSEYKKAIYTLLRNLIVERERIELIPFSRELERSMVDRDLEKIETYRLLAKQDEKGRSALFDKIKDTLILLKIQRIFMNTEMQIYPIDRELQTAYIRILRTNWDLALEAYGIQNDPKLKETLQELVQKIRTCPGIEQEYIDQVFKEAQEL